VIRIRDAEADEADALERLQRRSSDVWEQYREQLAAHPDAIELPQTFIDAGWVRVAVAEDGRVIGFYEKVGFAVVGAAETRFGSAVRMRRGLAA
jgi:ribosomal protein S18 acetylase RimI-like enzyme